MSKLMRWFRRKSCGGKFKIVFILGLLCLILHKIEQVLVGVNFTAHKAPIGMMEDELSYLRQHTVNITFEPTFCIDISCVLVLGYFRGGTTMTLDVLAESDKSFYVFEPITDLTERTNINKDIKFVNGTVRNPLTKRELQIVQTEMLMNWFECEFHKLNIGDVIHSNLMLHSRLTKKFYACTIRSDIGFCLHMLKSICFPRDVRIVKVIRLRMIATLELLMKSKNLKIIFIVRDPRAQIYSGVNNKIINPSNVSTYADTLCSTMISDIQTTKVLKQLFPNSIYVVKYEAIVLDPIESFKKLFHFVQLKFTEKVHNFIKRHLMAPSERLGNPWLTRSGDGNEIANKWRIKIEDEMLEKIDRKCQQTYKMFGYKQMKIKFLHDVGENLQVKPAVNEVFDLY